MKEIRLSGNYKEWTVSQTQLGKILELSQARINQMIDEQIIERDEGSKSGAVFLIDSLKNYYSSKYAGGNSVDFWKERALNERAKRSLNEIKLAKTRGELYEAETVEKAFLDLVAILRSNLLALPAKFATQLENKSRVEVNAILSAEINYMLEEISKFDAGKMEQ